jgi:hypothetical protein
MYHGNFVNPWKKYKLPEIVYMESKSYSLDIRENNRIMKVVQILFGIVCISIAIIWAIFNIKSLKSESTLWISVTFLTGFGAFQVYSGLGLAARFIEFATDTIRLKKNSLLKPGVILADQIEKIEMFPLSMVIFLKNSKKIILRFGISNPETVENIKKEFISFSASNNFPLEIRDEKLQ